MAGPDGPIPERVALRPLANPLPVGFLALAVVSTTYAGVQLGWVPTGESRIAAYAALGLAAPLQLLAAVMGFWGRDPVAATGLSLQCGLWTLTGVVTLATPPGSTTAVFGLLLVCLGLALLVPATNATGKPVALAVFATTATRCFLLGAYQLGAGAGWQTTAGIVGLLLGALAWYAGLAFELEASHGHAVLPLGRPGPVVPEGQPGVRSRL